MATQKEIIGNRYDCELTLELVDYEWKTQEGFFTAMRACDDSLTDCLLLKIWTDRLQLCDEVMRICPIHEELSDQRVLPFDPCMFK